MGSGFMIVIDEGTCILDFAKYFHTFSEEESCGKCVPCREGTQHLLRIINRICDGHGTLDDLALLERLAKTMRSASLCALGLTASNPVMAAIKYFREEVEAHIVDKKCPAGVCTNLITLRVDEAICDGCGECVKVCPSGAIQGKQKSPHRIDQVLCTHCCACKDVCPVEAVISE